jgi:anti-sigma regulatory factor (Ser/Thr protein kinase)/CheY-like chemotaxis protein
MPRKALIVAEDRDLATCLAGWGFDVTVLTEGRPAAAWARAQQPALILLDLLLPGADSQAICQELKLDRQTNLIPVIAITAHSEPEDGVHGLRIGTDACLCRAFTEAQLGEAVAQALADGEELRASGTRGQIHFRMGSDTRHLEQLNRRLASLLLLTPLSEAQVRQLTLAVRELGANAIEWGHQNQVSRPVTVTYRVDTEKVTILIRDTGLGFDPGRLPHAARPDDPLAHLAVRQAQGLREGGYGILLARGLVDRLEYNAAGNEVRLVKYFSAP